MPRVPPTYSTRRIGQATHHESHDHGDGVIHNRKARRARPQRHNPLFTSGNVWRRLDRLNDYGLLVRFQRIAKRRGKSPAWAEKRLTRFLEERKQRIREYNIWIEEQMEKARAEAAGTDIQITTTGETDGTE